MVSRKLLQIILRQLLLMGVVVCALVFTVLLSHATWYPGLLQVVANNFDPNRFYLPSDEEYLQMIQDPFYCTKNEDCQIVCRPSEFTTNCNSRTMNTYSDTQLLCAEIGCRPQAFTYASCRNNQCQVRGF